MFSNLQKRILDVLVATAILLPIQASARPPVPGSFAELADLRAACQQKPWQVFQASGYDRGGGYYDSGNFLRIEPDRHYVMMETEGPGCIDRLWFTRKSNHEPYRLLIYVDDPNTPAIDIHLDELLSGKHPPFAEPFAGSVNLARYCYVPIGFSKYCKVVAVPTADDDEYNWRTNSAGLRIPHIYYQITYRRFSKGTPVRTFRWKLDEAEQKALADARELWQRAGSSPWKNVGELEEKARQDTLAPGKAVTLFDLKGPAVIYGLQMKLNAPRNARLSITWDDQAEPAVDVPLGVFFASPEQKEVQGLWLGCSNGEYYCHFPMPFHKQAKIVLTSQEADAPIELHSRLRYRQETPKADDLYFFARAYDYNPPPADHDYVVLSTEGTGHFTGIIMDRPGNMEGDDRFYIDNKGMPAIHGTGTEDFFSFAWGFDYLETLPLHGITQQAGKTLCYRVHLPAGVPYRENIHVSWEHGSGNTDQGHYSGIALFYQK